MNIIEAIKSGRRFRRRQSPCRWIEYHKADKYMTCMTGKATMEFHPDKDDILADDWEAEENKVEITKSKLKSAVIVATKRQTNFETFADRLAEELGL